VVFDFVTPLAVNHVDFRSVYSDSLLDLVLAEFNSFQFISFHRLKNKFDQCV
jgi:hypothetical protein